MVKLDTTYNNTFLFKNCCKEILYSYVTASNTNCEKFARSDPSFVIHTMGYLKMYNY